MRNNASLSDFRLTSLFTLFFYNQIINTIFIKTFLIFYLIIYVYYTTFPHLFLLFKKPANLWLVNLLELIIHVLSTLIFAVLYHN